MGTNLFELLNRVHHSDCVAFMKTLPDNCIDSIVTDPPYELGFMGKSWDNTGIANSKEMRGECLRILKPGGYLLSFSGTRTYHRMACAIEDAGFEVRDMIEWVYGSGFPKSLNIGKAVDKLNGIKTENKSSFSGVSETRDNTKNIMRYKKCDECGKLLFSPDPCKCEWRFKKSENEWSGWGTALKPAHEPICMARKPIEKTVAENCLKWGTGGINIDESRVFTEDNLAGGSGRVGGFAGQTEGGELSNYRVEGNNLGRFPANLILEDCEEVRECFPESKSTANIRHNKASENICMSGKNYERDGYGYDDSGNASRFFKSIIYQPKASKSERNKGCDGLEDRKISGMPDITMKIYADKAEREVLAKLFTEYLVKTDKEIADSYGFSPALIRMWRTGERIPNKETYYRLKSEFNIPNDLDYIYEIEQGERKSIIDSPTRKSANNHPTVKPIKLMEYLIKMVTPKGGIVLDPFAGSGSTLVAAKQNGYGYIGTEMTDEYIPIIEARLSATELEEEEIIDKGWFG